MRKSLEVKGEIASRDCVTLAGFAMTSPYYLTTSYFTGKLDGDFDTTSFTLRKLYDYYDWNLYGSNYYGYGYWDNYYYTKSRVNGSAGSVATDSVTTQVSKEAAAVSPENFTFGRRFNKE